MQSLLPATSIAEGRRERCPDLGSREARDDRNRRASSPRLYFSQLSGVLQLLHHGGLCRNGAADTGLTAWADSDRALLRSRPAGTVSWSLHGGVVGYVVGGGGTFEY